MDAKSLMKDGRKGTSTGESHKAGSEVASPEKGADSDSDIGEVKCLKSSLSRE